MLQFALQDLKIALANTPSVHPLFVLYCIVYYKSECVRGRGSRRVALGEGLGVGMGVGADVRVREGRQIEDMGTVAVG